MSAIENDATLGDAVPEVELDVSEATSTRDVLEAAFNKLAEEPKATEPVAAPAEPVAKEPAAETEAKTDEEAPKPTEAPKPEDIKAPRMWSEQVKAKFASLPEDVQSEILRREREIDTKLRETAQERQIAALARQSLEPHMDHFRELGVAPFDAVNEMLNMGKVLTKGTAEQKVKLISQLIRNNKVDLVALENQLVEAYKRPDDVIEMEQRLRQLERQNQSMTSAQQQAALAEQTRQIEAFAADPKNEYFKEVASDMAVLLNSGRAKGLQDAYEAACRMNTEVWSKMQARAKQNTDRIAAGKAGVRGGAPRTTSTAKPVASSTRAALEAAWDELAGE